MKFNGQSSVEVRPHSNLDELKTVTSISFYIRVDPDKDPIEDRFLLYLGDKQVSIREREMGPKWGSGYIIHSNNGLGMIIVCCWRHKTVYHIYIGRAKINKSNVQYHV